ncbi:hypothetical protein M378DRAFT_72735 [Amanita muscaria Koide BX008]|uniref:Glutathione synthetase n=1 Tax=Amanita muscaria (strain Koide BX008) TaxID=946122 RepID=A0A0C2XE95_AMAMK|nr:hypothetical protein M378DRAFT_72735 [Amanita muscaria Koide BX008]
MSSSFKFSEWPPTLTGSQLEALSVHATTYALAHSLLYLPPGQSQPTVPTSAIHAPFALLPSPFPRKPFLEAKRLQRIYNVLYARIAMDVGFLDNVMGTEHGLGQVDDFIGQLWSGWKLLRDEGLAQPLHLGIFRSDYLLHSPSENDRFLKQVEFNTISASFGVLSQRVSELHRYLYNLTSYYNVSSYITADNFPENNTLSTIAEGLAAAHSAYNVQSAWILFVVQPNERNVFDQRWIEYELFDKYQIRVIRQTFDQLAATATVDSTSRLHINASTDTVPSGSVEISVVYYRSGYVPSEYTTPNHYSVRFLLERSRAIKCPTIALQLAGSKKIQQVLTQPDVLESFLCDPKRGKVFTPSEVEAVRNTFMAMWGLEVSEDGLTPDHEATGAGREEYGVRRARDKAHSLVLKPQREGGGNNVYKDDIPAFLDKLDPPERQAWIAMELITPPQGTGNYLLRAGNRDGSGTVKTEVISELGIYGWALFADSEGVIEKEGGWLLRTKGKENNEGGVATGFSVLDSVLLVDD